ncbi:MAG: sigma-70 family RNA polymerase sigma factor [Actinomycetota bacterium]|nr:sigma-70 family RNA polymerase sigma factor [Actinomycetota bacterium]
MERRTNELDDLYRNHAVALTRLAHVITGSNAVAQELVHEAFIRYTRARDVREPAAYLRTILVNLARSEERRSSRPLPRPAQARFEEPSIDETWQAVQRLPEKYRTALALRYYADMSEAQMAEHLGCRPGTVKSLVSRGLDLLRKELAP